MVCLERTQMGKVAFTLAELDPRRRSPIGVVRGSQVCSAMAGQAFCNEKLPAQDLPGQRPGLARQSGLRLRFVHYVSQSWMQSAWCFRANLHEPPVCARGLSWRRRTSTFFFASVFSTQLAFFGRCSGSGRPRVLCDFQGCDAE